MQLRKSIFILSLFASLLPALAGAYPAEVSRTGQTTCYDTAGIVIDCDDTGQDGDWLAVCPGLILDLTNALTARSPTISQASFGLKMQTSWLRGTRALITIIYPMTAG